MRSYAEEATQRRAEIRSLLKDKKLLYLNPVLSAYETKLRLLDRDKKAAKEWLENHFATESSRAELHRLFMQFTTVRAYIVLGEYEKAKALAEKLQKLCTAYHRLLDSAEAAVLLTIVLWLTGNKEEAFALLKRALVGLEPYRYIRVFADEGKAIMPILRRLTKKGSTADGNAAPGSAYLRTVYLAVYEQSKRYKGMAHDAERRPVNLSAKQEQMIALLAQGYKNAEIVQITGLSINTVRYHTKLAYQKLNVTNAMDAVLRAKELNLLG